MKNLMLLIFCCLTLNLFSQNQPILTGIESFSQWENNEGGALPKFWDGFNKEIIINGFPVGIVTTITKDCLDTYDGNYSVVLQSQSVMGGPSVSGLLTTGIFEVDFQNHTGDITGGLPITSKPLYLKGWFKYTPGISDTAQISIGFTNNGADIGGGILKINDTVDVWTQFSIPINYIMGQSPDSFNIVFSTSTLNTNVPLGSVLKIDHIYLDYTASNNSTVSEIEKRVKIYPNPANQYTSIQMDFEGQAMLFIFDSNGKRIIEKTIYNTDNQLDISGLEKGVYFVKIISSERIFTEKLIIN